MKIIFFKFEKIKIHFIEFLLRSDQLVMGENDILSFESCDSSGEKYKKILDELLQIKVKFSPDLFCYHFPQKMMGKVDEGRYANEAMLHLFCYEKQVRLEVLYKPDVRKILNIKDKEFRQLVEEEKKKVITEFNIAKSNNTLEGIAFLSLIKDKF